VPAYGVVALLAVFFSVKTYRQCDVWDNSLALWNNVIRNQPKVAMAYYNRGTHLMKDSVNSERAVADFTKAIELQPNYSEAFNNRGVVLMNNRKYDAALDDYKTAIELNKRRSSKPSSHSVNTDKLNENCAQTYNFRGIGYLKAKKYELAEEDFNLAIEMKPDFTSAYYNKGVANQQEKDYSEAIDCYTKVIELNPDYANAYYNRAVAHYDSGERGECCNDLNSAAALGNEQAEKAIKDICR
jgi:tetratricopeptide (TPR) repeat protein